MGKGFKPDIKVGTCYDIDAEQLRNKGYTCFVFDIDNTLEEYSVPLPSAKMIEWFKSLKEMGFSVCILSNAKPYRAQKFAEGFSEVMDVLVIGKALKPRKKGFKQVSEALGCQPKEMIMVGDQLFTDILGGNRYGCYTVLVEPINLKDEPGFVKFKRIFEKLFK